MRRKPIYFVLECSNLTTGSPSNAVAKGFFAMLHTLRVPSDPQWCEWMDTTSVSVITFGASPHLVISRTELNQLQLPEWSTLNVGWFHAALELLQERINTEVSIQEDYKPFVYLLIDCDSWKWQNVDEEIRSVMEGELMLGKTTAFDLHVIVCGPDATPEMAWQFDQAFETLNCIRDFRMECFLGEKLRFIFSRWDGKSLSHEFCSDSSNRRF